MRTSGGLKMIKFKSVEEFSNFMNDIFPSTFYKIRSDENGEIFPEIIKEAIKRNYIEQSPVEKAEELLQRYQSNHGTSMTGVDERELILKQNEAIQYLKDELKRRDHENNR
jgi:hypothetical protein